MSYLFYSPLDQMPVEADTIEQIREKAKEYLGTEDWEGESVIKLGIYRLERVETIERP